MNKTFGLWGSHLAYEEDTYLAYPEDLQHMEETLNLQRRLLAFEKDPQLMQKLLRVVEKIKKS